MEEKLANNTGNPDTLLEAKKMGFSDKYIARLWNCKEIDVYNMRKENNLFPVFKMVDTCHTNAYIPYFYSSYTGENTSRLTDKKKIIVLGAGPIRIGQGVEFDYSTVHAVMTIKNAGYEAIIINNNPETVSTDYTTADKLYFEPLTPEDVMNIVEFEKPEGVIASLGGQTAINLAQPLHDRGVKIIGTDCAAIDRAEDRNAFENLLNELNIPRAKGKAVTKMEDGIAAAAEIGYPVLVRPSFVLGGRAMQIVANEEQLRHYLRTAVEIDEDKPVLVDKYIQCREVEIDAICDGRDVFVPGIMELVERTGIHSGDSISVYPTFSISEKVQETIIDYTKKLGLGIGIVGLYNIQFIVDKDDNLVALGISIFSLAEALRKAKGRLFPFGWWYMLKALFIKQPKRLDFLLAAVKPEYQSKGAFALVFNELIGHYIEMGIVDIESNPELEDNKNMQNLWADFEKEQHKRRRAFKKELKS